MDVTKVTMVELGQLSSRDLENSRLDKRISSHERLRADLLRHCSHRISLLGGDEMICRNDGRGDVVCPDADVRRCPGADACRRKAFDVGLVIGGMWLIRKDDGTTLPIHFQLVLGTGVMEETLVEDGRLAGLPLGVDIYVLACSKGTYGVVGAFSLEDVDIPRGVEERIHLSDEPFNGHIVLEVDDRPSWVSSWPANEIELIFAWLCSLFTGGAGGDPILLRGVSVHGCHWDLHEGTSLKPYEVI